ncbi:hypothetical protein [Bacillus arachidis]|uniref:hypothetical protein n=1 Tax=Bacillus arachidis TaxID=2819290 RepID=UPI00255C9C26|nr:hypothetical protein [Bacillus arachidis]WIY61627.1 hypothetical protein QRY57_03375 [Bacillus arachidis]
MLRFINERYIMTRQMRLDIEEFMPPKVGEIFIKIYKLAFLVFIYLGIMCLVNNLIGKEHPINGLLLKIEIIVISIISIFILYYCICYRGYYKRKE